LANGTNPAKRRLRLIFALFTARASVDNALTNTATAVSKGFFGVTLHFGANFPRSDRWLEIGVRTTVAEQASGYFMCNINSKASIGNARRNGTTRRRRWKAVPSTNCRRFFNGSQATSAIITSII
jgi:hypothetical protein